MPSPRPIGARRTRHRETLRVVARCKDGYCLVPHGCFTMGSPPDEPVRGRNTEFEHEVTLSQSFVMGQHEVTQNQWREAGLVSLAGTANSPGVKDCLAPTCPASTMSWYEAVQSVNALSDREGLSRR